MFSGCTVIYSKVECSAWGNLRTCFVFASPFCCPNILWCLLLLISASLLVWPSVSPPPTCLWWIWPFVLRNLWVYFQTCIIKVASVEWTLWFAYSMSYSVCLWVQCRWLNWPVGIHVSVLLTAGQVWWHQESGQGCSWWTHERYSGIHRGPGMHIQLSVLWPGFFSVLFYN